MPMLAKIFRFIVYRGDRPYTPYLPDIAALKLAVSGKRLETDGQTPKKQPDKLMYELDVAITKAINGLAGKSPALDALMIWISAVGVPILVLAVALQWWRKTDRSQVRHVIVAAGFSFIFGLSLNQLILLFVQRLRPYDAGISHLLIARSADPSFPSDHATATTAIAAAFLLHGMRRTGLVFLGAAIVVMISRIYIGTHYASDVLGGAITALIAALVVKTLYEEDTRLDRLVTSIL